MSIYGNLISKMRYCMPGYLKKPRLTAYTKILFDILYTYEKSLPCVPLPIVTSGKKYCQKRACQKKCKSCLTRLLFHTINEGFYHTYVSNIV